MTLNFNAKLNANDNKQITIGNFTVRAASNEAGNCANIQLIAGDENSRVATGSGGAFTSVGSNNNIDLQAGNTTDMFTAISENGGSTVSGIVGRVNVGGFCLVSGYVTGV